MTNLRIVLFHLIAIAQIHGQYPTILHVAQDGSGMYTSIQDAIDDTKSFPDLSITIYIKAGNYREKVTVPEWNPHLSLIGEDKEHTVISWNDHFSRINRGRNSTFFTATLTIEAEDVHLENLTIENTAGPVGQAIALAVMADRCTITGCRILGYQDALFADGSNARQYYRDCWIEGTTDFIFGQATALFENCTINSKSNSFITAASTSEKSDFGFVFTHCRLTADRGVDAVYLGRPWRRNAKTAFIHCEMGAHILPQGWDNWGDAKNETTVVYAELASTGPGANPRQRVQWSHQLHRRSAKKFLVQKLFKADLQPEFNPK